MENTYYIGNRTRLFDLMEDDALLVLFSGEECRKTNDEYYPFFAHRSFVYLTGIEQKQSILFLSKQNGTLIERIYMLPPDAMEERWTGKRLSPEETEQISGIHDIRPLSAFEKDFRTMAAGGHYSAPFFEYRYLYLDLYRAEATDAKLPSHLFLDKVREEFPYLQVKNADALIRRLRLYKQPCEIEALRKAEMITGKGIAAMMTVSHDGMYEYQYKARFDAELGMYGPEMHGFPPIISAGKNNFCIHYYSYTGCAKQGDLILNDVGAQWDHLIVDVSRAWPCCGHFTERQLLLYECALETSNHMFSTVKPGIPMRSIDEEIRRYNAECLVKAGALDRPENIGKLMWHGGAHHIGYDVHDRVETPEVIAPGMVFCIDVGIYHEEWGIGFRLEDNLLVTENGCENLSAAIPRTPEEIELAMK